jgi:hypothetical protein
MRPSGVWRSSARPLNHPQHGDLVAPGCVLAGGRTASVGSPDIPPAKSSASAATSSAPELSTPRQTGPMVRRSLEDLFTAFGVTTS